MKKKKTKRKRKGLRKWFLFIYLFIYYSTRENERDCNEGYCWGMLERRICVWASGFLKRVIDVGMLVMSLILILSNKW